MNWIWLPWPIVRLRYWKFLCVFLQCQTLSRLRRNKMFFHKRLNINASLWKPGTRPPHALTKAWTLTQATRLCANTGGGERVDDHHRFPSSRALKPALHYQHPPPPRPFSPPYHTFIYFLSHTDWLFYSPYLQSTNILRTIILLILTLSSFPPTNLLHAQTWSRTHPTYKKNQ